MPYLHMQIGKPLSAEEKCALYEEIGKIITLIPTKTKDNCMVRIEDDCAMYMRGERGALVFAEIRMFGPSAESDKLAFTRALATYLTNALGIEKRDFYMNLMEFPTWCSGGEIINI